MLKGHQDSRRHACQILIICEKQGKLATLAFMLKFSLLDIIVVSIIFFCFIPLGGVDRRHNGWRRVKPWKNHQFIAEPYVRIRWFGTLLKGTLLMPWRCSGSSPYGQNTFHVLIALGWQLAKIWNNLQIRFVDNKNEILCCICNTGLHKKDSSHCHVTDSLNGQRGRCGPLLVGLRWHL